MSLNPFAESASLPGHGRILLSILPPSTPVLQTLSYQYPLKLIAPAPASVLKSEGSNSHDYTIVHTVFLLTYGGGLVAGDAINLSINVASATRLVLLTQGSTKIFKCPSSHVVTRQHMTADIASDAALCYLPDPVQPFENSCFEQTQTYNLTSDNSNLCVCDWVCQGRPARGECWSFTRYVSRNEIWAIRQGQKRRLMLRDNLILDASAVANTDIRSRMDGLGVFGTLILCGQLFAQLAKFFLDEFQMLPRIGARQWDTPQPENELTAEVRDRARRVEQEKIDGVLWTAASSRGFFVVKFGATEIEGARRWLRCMLQSDGTIERAFGDRALLCLR